MLFTPRFTPSIRYTQSRTILRTVSPHRYTPLRGSPVVISCFVGGDGHAMSVVMAILSSVVVCAGTPVTACNAM